MACDLWLVPLVDVLCHSPDNPFAEEIAAYDKALTDAGLPPVPVYSYMPGLSGDVAPVAGFDYEALHFLRRAHLLHLCGLEVTPVDELGGDYEQLLEMFETTAEQSHLVWHYDHAGAYVPVDFAAPARQRRTAGRRRPAGLQPRAAARTGGRRPGLRHRPGQPAARSRAAVAAHGPGGTRRVADRLRGRPVRPGAPRLAGAARRGHAQPGAGLDDRLQLTFPAPNGLDAPPQLSAVPPAALPRHARRGSRGGAAEAGRRGLPSLRRTRRASGLRDCEAHSDAGPDPNSTIQSAVSARTISDTSSREAAQQGQAALGRLARAALGRAEHLADGLRRPVELEALQPPLDRLRGGDVPHPARVSPKQRSPPTHTTAQQQRQEAPRGEALGQRARQRRAAAAAAPPRRRPRRPPRSTRAPRRLHTRSAEIPVADQQRALLDPPVQLLQTLGGLAPVAERERPPRQVPAAASAPSCRGRPRAASPADSPRPLPTTPALEPLEDAEGPSYRRSRDAMSLSR